MKITTRNALRGLVETMLGVFLIGIMACVAAVGIGLFLRIVYTVAGF